MNKHESEFKELIKQLGAERPLTPEPDRAFTAGLRGRLLAQYERPVGWEIGRLANTATAIAILALVIFVGWFLSSSQQPTAISSSGIQTTRPAETAQKTFTFENDLQLVGYELSRPDSDTSQVQFTLVWHTAESPVDDQYIGFIHLLNENGEVIGEATQMLTWETAVGVGLATMSFTDGVADGRYQIYAGIYESETGNYLLSDGSAAVLLDTLVIEDGTGRIAEPVPMATPAILFSTASDAEFSASERITVDANLELTYRHYMQELGPDRYTHILRLYWEARQEPTEPLSAFVHILDEQGQLIQQHDEPLLWAAASGRLARPGFEVYALQSVTVAVPDGRYQVETGLYNQVTGEPLATGDGRTVIELGEIHIGGGPQVELWPLQASQSTRTTSDEAIEFELTVGYEITNFTEGFQAQLRFVNPQWLSGLGEPYTPEGENLLPMTADSDTLRYHVIIDPQQLEALTQHNIFMPVIDVITNEAGQPATIWRTELLSEMPMMINDVSERFYYEETDGEIVNTFFTGGPPETQNDVIAETEIPFGDNITLTYSRTIQTSPVRRQTTHLFHFRWQAGQPPGENLAAFVHVFNEQGLLVYQQDQQLVWTTASGQMTMPGFTEYAQQSVGLVLPNGRYQVEAGLYDTASGQQLTTASMDTAVSLDEFVVEGRPPASGSPTSSQLVSISQAARTSTEADMQIEAVINYDFTEVLEGEYEYAVKLHYAAPDWQSSTSGRAPIDGLALLPLTEDQGTLTVNISRSPQEMHTIAGTARLVLVTMFGRYELVGGKQQFRALAVVTHDEFPLLLDSVEAITYRIVDEEPQN